LTGTDLPARRFRRHPRLNARAEEAGDMPIEPLEALFTSTSPPLIGADGQICGAVIDESGDYRYALWRVWDPARPLLAFVMLNPSTADHRQNDPTIRRCIGFARGWGEAGGILVVNLFAYRSTDPKALRRAADPVGPENDAHLLLAADRCCRIVAAWGNGGEHLQRERAVLQLLASRPIFCLGTTSLGKPRHPLYVAASTSLRLLSMK
jgi:hypothetical protein